MPFCAYCGTQVEAISYGPCPSCGNPTNGAKRPAPAGGSNTAVIVAVVVGGLFVVLIIVAILAAIAIPNLLMAMDRSKQKRTMVDMRTIGAALEGYANDRKVYPQPEALGQSLVPTYARVLPMTDGWGRAMRYECRSVMNDGRCDLYSIGSAGKDGVFELESLGQYEPGATTNFNRDIIFADGNFVQYPRGVQAD
jgi:type II secretory pathway pseudopilin PulG